VKKSFSGLTGICPNLPFANHRFDPFYVELTSENLLEYFFRQTFKEQNFRESLESLESS